MVQYDVLLPFVRKSTMKCMIATIDYNFLVFVWYYFLFLLYFVVITHHTYHSCLVVVFK